MSFFSEITPQQRLDKAVIAIWENPQVHDDCRYDDGG